ncbi:hypothetical protein [Acidovorax sp. Leaf191]|nr:hypothetical protein [Acidovorax sp. Leaf191]
MPAPAGKVSAQPQRRGGRAAPSAPARSFGDAGTTGHHPDPKEP